MEIPNELNVIYTDDFTSTALYTVTLLQTENNSMLQVALESVPNLGCIYITGTSKVVSFVGHYHIHNTNQKCEPYVILTHNRHIRTVNTYTIDLKYLRFMLKALVHTQPSIMLHYQGCILYLRLFVL